MVKKKFILLFVCALVIFSLSCYQPEYVEFWFADTIKWLFGVKSENHFEIASRIQNNLITFLSGGIICIAGAMFQSIFKNPLASPRTIGSTAGVTLGNMVFVLVYGTSVTYFESNRYFFCYGFSILIVFLVCLLGKAFNGKSAVFPVEAILIVGIMVSNFSEVFVKYCQYLLTIDDTGLIYKYMQYANGDIIFLDRTGLRFFYGFTVLGIIFMLLISRKIDLLTFDDIESYSMGINVNLYRISAICIGSILSTAAIVHCGGIGFLSMMIPYLFRTTSKKGFYDVGFKSFVVGGLFMVVTRTIYSILLHMGIGLPSSSVVTIISIPLFLILFIKESKSQNGGEIPVIK